MTDLTAERIAELLALHAKATHGKWEAGETKVNGEHICWNVGVNGASLVSEVLSGPTFGTVEPMAQANAKLIAAMHNAAPELIDLALDGLRLRAAQIGMVGAEGMSFVRIDFDKGNSFVFGQHVRIVPEEI